MSWQHSPHRRSALLVLSLRQSYLHQNQRKFQLLGHDEVAGKYKKAFSALLRAVKPIEFAGLTFEMLPKVKAYQMLTRELGWPKREAGAYVNNYLGVPNFREQGKHTRIVQSYLPFFQVFLKGFERDLGLAAGRQRFGKDMSAPAWWMRYMASDGLWTVMQALGTAGVLGAGIKEWYDSQSEYNKTNYNLVPIGFLEGGEHGKRGVGLRVPRDETTRLISGMIHKAIVGAAGHDAGAWNEMAAFGSGQVPTVNPVVELGSEWMSYVNGQNPIDAFRGEPILSNHEYLTGGWTGAKGMLEWSYDQTGLQNFVRWNPLAETVMEMAVSGVPVLNRFLVVSDYGYRELQDQAAEEMSRERHMLRAAMPKNVQRVLAEYYGLRGIRTKLRTEAQAARADSLGAWYRFIFKPNEEALLSGEDAAPIMTSLEEATEAFEE